MIGYNFKYNGQSFSDDIFDKTTGQGIRFTSVDWTNLVTTNDQSNKQGQHGIIVSGTYIRGRIISISGTIEANSRSKRDEYKQILQSVFLPPYNPSPLNKGFHDFEFFDDDGLEWKLSAKVVNTPDYSPNFSDFTTTTFNIQLICENPIIISKESFELSHSEGFYGGVNLPVTLPVALNSYGYVATIMNMGLWTAPLKVTITANNNIGTNIRLINTVTESFIGVQSAMLAGDVLVIDSGGSPSITLNGMNVSADRITGSIFQFLEIGNNSFIVRDDSQILGDGLSVDVLFEWNSVKM